MRMTLVRWHFALLSASVLVLAAGASAAQASTGSTSSLGTYSPTFVGPAATGCASGCSLLSGPITTTSSPAGPSSQKSANALAGPSLGARAVPSPRLRGHGSAHAAQAAATTSGAPIPTITCQPLGVGCDSISTSAGGAVGVKGLNAVDSATYTTNIYRDVEPPDQALCAGNGSVVEANNIGEILVYNTALQRQSSPISLDQIMGLNLNDWSSGGDPSCFYDSSNGGHWIYTEIVSKSAESNGGAFVGCFAGNVPNSCYEGIAVSQGANPLGPYWVYYLNANYNESEPGAPYLLNDFAKISVTRDAFLLFYDEFPLNGGNPGVGGGFFNGAQQLAFDKAALETGQPVLAKSGKPNVNFNVAIENMGQIPTPDGTCAKDNTYGYPGVACWYSVIPAQPADAGQYDNGDGGSGFMLATLDFYGQSLLTPTGDNRLAVFDWTGLGDLGSRSCGSCSRIRFGGELFSGVEPYSNQGQFAAQKAGPIPLGDQCLAAGATSQPCPEGGLATNGDNITQASQADGQLWAAATTQVNQAFRSGTEVHQGVAYWEVGTGSFDSAGTFSLTGQGYAAAAHEDLEMPAMAGEGTGGNGRAIALFTLSGNGGPKGADHGGFYPSTSYGRLDSGASGLLDSTIHIADAGQSPQDGFSEYQGYPGPTRPRWGDYSEGIYLPDGSNRIYFANEYIQYPSCTGSGFDPNGIGTCGGTRDGQANWGTSVNYVVP